MEEREFRLFVQHHFVKGKSPEDTRKRSNRHYGESVSLIETSYEWYQHFRNRYLQLNILKGLLRLLVRSDSKLEVGFLSKQVHKNLHLCELDKALKKMGATSAHN